MTFGHDLDRLRAEMEELFSDLWQGRRIAGPRRAFRPAADVYRTDDPPAITVVVDLAGVDPADVELTVDGGVLSLRGVRRRPPAARCLYHQIELDYGSFERRIPVGDGVDSNAARASYDRGLLTVVLPLAQEQPRPAPVLIRVERRT